MFVFRTVIHIPESGTSSSRAASNERAEIVRRYGFSTFSLKRGACIGESEAVSSGIVDDLVDDGPAFTFCCLFFLALARFSISL